MSVCSNCGSIETEFEESKTDKSVVGGKVHIWRCLDCGQVTEDVPCSVYDEMINEGSDQ